MEIGKYPKPPGLALLRESARNTQTVAGGRYGEAMQRTIDTEEFA